MTAEPIAIIGMGCRLPGGIDSPASFWEFLVGGKNAITEVPPNRWNRDAYYSKNRAHAGKLITREGGFLENIDLFDPGFFGISETEAPYIDPQQRILLEITWEAFERAGLVMENYRGRPVGVFIGCFTTDYLHIQFADPYEVGAYTATGAIGTMVAARISHAFDFRGPSMTVDTACSSSLHSVHLACESLRAGDSDVAVAGGSQLTLIPEFNIAETKAGFLSDAAQCRMFDASARGYVRSEGIGVVVLKRLRDARAANDPIQAVILGSAMNQDGRTPSIAQPNPEAQKEVMRLACKRAGIRPEAVHYVEAHGTGTSAGDRAEAEAIGMVFRVEAGCPSELIVGSVKSNIGHTEAAAGICGLMKAALCVKQHAAPPNLHFETPNPAIGFEHLRLRVPVTFSPLPGDPVVACVNSFGFGGSNAVVVLRGPNDQECEKPASPRPKRQTFLLPLSARSEPALEDTAHSMEAWLRNSPAEVRVEDLCHTAGVRRQHHKHRRALVASSLDSLREQLGSMTIGRTGDFGKGTVWVFSGAGNQRYQTGLQLFQEEAIFRETIERCDEIYRRLAGLSLIDVLRSRSSVEFIEEAWLAHPVTVSIQLGLAALFRSWGVEPAAIVGHSLGETAAFHAAGIYSLEQTLQLVYHRCECLRPLHRTGGMLAVAANEESIMAALGTDFAVAAINGPKSVTLSARGPLLEATRQRLNKAGIACQLLAESFACHHRYPALEAAAQELEERMQSVNADCPHIPLYSTVTGNSVDGPCPSSYWAMHLLEPVKLRPVISMLAKQGFARFLELGSHPALTASIAATINQERPLVFSSLHPDKDERSSLLRSLGGLYETGERIDWRALYPSGEVLDLPAYSWQRNRFWREPEASHLHRTRQETSRLLGERLAGGRTLWRAEISVEKFPFLLDHRIAGEALFPAAGYVDMALCAGREHFDGLPFVIEDLRLIKAIPLNSTSAFFFEFELDADRGTFSIYATPSLTLRSTRRVAEGRLRSLPPGVSVTRDPPLLDMPADSGIAGDQLYERFAESRYEYRGAFRGIRHAWIDREQAFCEIELPLDAEMQGYSFHPAALDAALQTLLCIREARESSILDIPDRIGSIRVLGTPTRRMLVWAGPGELRIFDDARRLIAHIAEFSTRRVQRFGSSTAVDRYLYQTVWRPDERVSIPSEQNGVWVILSGACNTGERLARQLLELGATRVVVDSWRTEPGEVLGREPSIAGVIHLGNLDLPILPSSALANSSDTCCISLLNLARRLSRRRGNPKLWVITSGAHQLSPSDSPSNPFQAASWGLARAIGQREVPGIWGGLIDLSHDRLQSEIEGAASSILMPSGEDQLAFRGSSRFALRLREIAANNSAPPSIAFRHVGAYLVTGAFGALGLEVARWMVARGARRLILSTSSHESARRSSLVAELELAGAAIEVVVLDLSNAGEVAAFCDQRQRHARPIRGVIYCAGRSRDQLAVSADSATFDEVFNSKVSGAWTLHQALRGAPLEHFVLFSSVASVLPNPGMGAYAAANRFLDALASHRRSLGLPGLSIAWGPWEIGMTERSGIKQYLDRAGFQCFTVPQALRVLERLWHSEYPEPIALAVDWPRALGNGHLRLPILNDLQIADRTQVDAASKCHPDSTEERMRGLVAGLTSARTDLDIAIPLVDQGLDSLGATVLIETLYREFGMSVEAEALADGLSLRDLVEMAP
jgi:acyl transferase domain-containing protein/acyl carrier protein